MVCPRSRVPVGAATDGPWTAFYTDGTIAFDTTGIVAGLTLPLANIQCPVFVISTFDGDLILVPTSRRADAITAWTESGHTF
ncbi:ACT domain-containing protein [Rhodococcus corynebacterioides]|nr:ACT domain-containing protein [Rhodococcus corynebacterioides]